MAPGFLAAMPQLEDPNFHRSVVLLLRHDEQGAFGLIINRDTPISVEEICSIQDLEYRGSSEARVMMGGPVEMEHHLLVLHGDEACLPPESDDEVEIVPGVRLITAREGLAILAGLEEACYRCYVGYAGWGPGQLDAEIREGAWVHLDVDASLVFAASITGVWQSALHRLGIDPITLVPGGPPS